MVQYTAVHKFNLNNNNLQSSLNSFCHFRTDSSSSKKDGMRICLDETRRQGVLLLAFVCSVWISVSKTRIQFGSVNHSFYKDMVSEEILYLKIEK